MNGRLLLYLRFRRRSINRHGVHSPFVFDLLEKGLRPQSGKPLPARLQSYLGRDAIRVLMPEELGSLSDKAPVDTAVIYVPGIHQSHAALELWRSAAQSSSVTLSLEFWEGGLLFFRKDFLVKQHFLLRYKR